MNQPERQTLGVGQRLVIKKSWTGKSVELLYAGMPSAESYSVVVSWTRNYNSAAYNLFFPVSCRGFDVMQYGHVTVQEVTPDLIRLIWVAS